MIIEQLSVNTTLLVSFPLFQLHFAKLAWYNNSSHLASDDYFLKTFLSRVAPTCTGSTSGCISNVETVFSTGHNDHSNKYADRQKCTSCLAFCLFALCRYKTSRSYYHDNHSHCYLDGRGYFKSDQPSYSRYL